jgi:hypothetical protein
VLDLRTSLRRVMSAINSSASERPESQNRTIFRGDFWHPSQSHHGGDDGGIPRFKRPALAELSPAHSKRTNSLITEANGGILVPVTPNVDENYSKFPGLYYRNYLPIQDREHCFHRRMA